MSTTSYSKEQITAPDGHTIPVHLWDPAEDPVAIILVFHGLGEHAARYARFAAAANRAGYAVAAHDHRGHGPDADPIGYFAPDDGWKLLVDDGRLVFDSLVKRYPGRPVVLLGHSMGSYIAQSYAMRFGDDLAAMILSGSTWPSRLLLRIGRLLARFESWRLGRKGESPLLDKLGFGDFNKKFEPARTELDWLSRDPDEVDLYIADPLCGGPYTTGLWIDLLGGLLEISRKANLRRIPANLRILITGGGDDPVGGDAGMFKLYLQYERAGREKLSKAIYDKGRHEMLNETNRDDFTADLLSWTARQLDDYQA